MAFIAQQPNKWNLAYAPNIFTLQFTQSPYEIPSEKFVLTVEVNGVEVARYKQPPNPAGAAHFDVSKVLQTYLNPSFVEDTTLMTVTPGAAMAYQVKYGVENGGVTTIQGASSIRHVLNGYTNWRTKNWDYVGYMPSGAAEACLCELEECLPFNMSYTPDVWGNTKWPYLTNWPTLNQDGRQKFKVRRDEYRTVSFFPRNQNWEYGGQMGPNESIFFLKYDFYTSNGGTLATYIFPITETNGVPIRENCQDYTTHGYTFDELVTTAAAGLANFDFITQGTRTLTSSYKISTWSINACYINDNGAITDCEDTGELADYLGDKLHEAEFIVEDKCSAFEPVNLSFMNSFGVKDYYTFDRRNTLITAIDRSTYTKSLGTWSEALYTIDPQGRGKTTFSTLPTTVMQLSTDWMNDEESAWLQELFLSPNALIYYNGVWEPVVISSTSYQQKTFARDKMFQHTIEVTFANNNNIQIG